MVTIARVATRSWQVIEADNFLSWKSLRLNLTKHRGITLLLGANGNGKSAIWDALSWTLFGTTIRGLNGAEVIRHNTDRVRGMVSWIDSDDTFWKVERVRHGNEQELKLFRKDKVISAAVPTATQRRIETVLGYDHTGFVAATVFGQDVTRWAKDTDRGQKAILERLVGLTVWERMLEHVRRESKGAALAQQIVQADIARGEENLKQNEKFEANLAADRKEFLTKVKAIIPEVEGKRTNLNRRDAQAKIDRASLERKLKDASNVLKSVEALFENHEEFQQKRLALEAQAEERAHRRHEVNGRIKDLKRSIPKRGAPCPTCARPTDTKAHQHVARGQTREIAQLESELRSLDMAERACNIKMKDLQPCSVDAKSYKVAQERVRELEGKLAALDLEAKDREAQRAELQHRIDLLEGERSSLADRAQSYKDSRKIYEAGLKASRERLDDMGANQKAWGWLEEACGPGGVRSLLMDNVLPLLNKTVNGVLRTIGPGMSVRIEAQSRLKSTGELRDKISCTVRVNGNETLYLGLSNGQRQRVDIAVALGLQRIAAQRKPMGLTVFDEIFERVDPEGCERVANYLRRDVSGPVWVITHNDAFQSLFPNAMTVAHNGDCSELRTA